MATEKDSPETDSVSESFYKLSVTSDATDRIDSGFESGNLPSDSSDGRFILNSGLGLPTIHELESAKFFIDKCDSTESGKCFSTHCVSKDSGICVSSECISEQSEIFLSNQTEQLPEDTRLNPYEEISSYSSEPTLAFNEAIEPDEDGDTQIHMSIIQSRPDILMNLLRLLPNHIYLNIQNKDHQTPLHLAVITQQIIIARSLICAGASLDYRDFNGNTPLHITAKNGNALMAEILLEPVQREETLQNPYTIPYQKIPQNMETRNYDGQMCTHVAAEKNNIEVLGVLLEREADINARDGKSGRTILHYAAENRNIELLYFLLNWQQNLNINAVTYGGLTPIKLAHGRGHSDVVNILLQAGASEFEDSSEEEEMEEEFNDIQINGVRVTSSSKMK